MSEHEDVMSKLREVLVEVRGMRRELAEFREAWMQEPVLYMPEREHLMTVDLSRAPLVPSIAERK